jgi:N-acyl-D-amino-acid deacylase
MFVNLIGGHFKERLLKELPIIPKDILVIARAPGNKFLEGKTIGQFAKNQELSLNEAILKLMISTQLKAVVLYKNLNLSLVKEALFHDRALIGSNNSRFSEKLFLNFLKFSSEKSLSVEKVIAKITSLPAEKFNLVGRGKIKEGMIADLVLIKDPLIEPIINTVILNGKIAVKDNVSQNLLAGEVVKKI